MTTTADADVAIYQGHVVEEYRPRIVMEPADAKALDDQLRACMLAVLRPGVDYGTIPGMGDKPSLFKPGAEKLLQWFGFGFTSERGEIERDGDGNHVGVTYRCTVTKGLPDGRTITIATCEGYAGYDEDRFYVSAEMARAKAESKERYNAAKYNRAPNEAKWQFAAEYRAPWNTVIKMAQKRAHVGAAIDATAAAGLFTQDLEDMTPLPAASDDAKGGNGQPAGDTWENAKPAARKADRSHGTPDDDQWYSATPAPPQDSEPWTVDRALAEAAAFKTEAEGQRLQREAAQALLDAKCAPDQATHIQNVVDARIYDLRKKAAAAHLRQLSEDDDWRAKVEELMPGDDEAARVLLEELRQLVAAATMDRTRAGRIGRAIIALCPRAAIQDPEAAA